MIHHGNHESSDTQRFEASCYLSANVYACEVPGGAVFLDLDSLQYSAIDAQCVPVLRRAVRNWVPNAALRWPADTDTSSQAALLEALFAKGLLCVAPPDRAHFPCPPRPTTACTPNWNLRASTITSTTLLLQIAWTYLRTILFLRTRQLRLLVNRLPEVVGVRASDSGPSQPLKLLVTQFVKLRVWFYTARDACLLDSLVMTSVLRRHKIDARLHIGVAVAPFSAHAWVQVGSCVLDDTVEHVCEYTPILVL